MLYMYIFCLFTQDIYELKTFDMLFLIQMFHYLLIYLRDLSIKRRTHCRSFAGTSKMFLSSPMTETS